MITTGMNFHSISGSTPYTYCDIARTSTWHCATAYL